MVDRSFQSVVDILHHRAGETPNRPGLIGRNADGWYELTWSQVEQRARRIACGLLSLGLAKGERVGILAATRPEWMLVDLGILGAAGATTTIYPSNTPEECSFILSDSGAVTCFAENAEQAAKLVEERASLPDVRKVIWIDGEPPAGDDWMISLAELEELGAKWSQENPDGYEQVSSAVGPDDLATLIYTSGTTGRPKGVMLNHSNWVYEANAVEEMALLVPEDKHYLFLPLAHSFAKVLGIASIRVGSPTVVEGSIDRLVDYLGETNPTVMAAVPRVFEKVYNKVVTGAEEAGGLKLKIFEWAVAVGRKASALKQQGREPGGLLALKVRLADKLVYSKLKDRFGGRIRFFISGGAPLAREIAEFFHAADILVLEGYGLTETSAASFVNRLHKYKFGTVGQPVPGTRVRLDDDGEILIKGGGVMQGYYNLPDDTAETLTEDGWLRTGDIGEVDADGFLRITDRKKDIIVTAGGKNVAPQKVENLIKAHSPYVSQVVMLGDRKPYCIGLVTLNEETVGPWARERGIAYSDYADLASKPEVEALLWQAVQSVNVELASYETIKKIKLLDADFSIETGEMTPKMSIKRPVVSRRYADLIEGIYEGRVETLG